MTTGNFKKNKKLKKLIDHHAYLNKKVEELTEDRKKDRSDESKTLLMRLKKKDLNLWTLDFGYLMLKLLKRKKYY